MPTATRVKKAIQKPLETVPDAAKLVASARRKRAAHRASLIRFCIAWKRDFEEYLEIHYGGLSALAATGFKRHLVGGPGPSVHSKKNESVPKSLAIGDRIRKHHAAQTPHTPPTRASRPRASAPPQGFANN